MLWRRRSTKDFNAEIKAHLQLETDQLQEQGFSEQDAGAAARRAFGNPTQSGERFFESAQWFRGDLLQDLRYGVRTLVRSPGFCLLVVLTLALGIGANTAIFSVMHAVLLRPPPYPSGERLVEIWETTTGQNIPVSWINFGHWRAENRSFEDLAGFENADLTLTGHGTATLTHAGLVSVSFFRLTGWHPMSGRLFNESDDRPGAALSVLISDEFWTRVLNRDPGAVGAALNLDGRPYQIIGVLPPRTRFFIKPVDLYLAIGPAEGVVMDRAVHGSMAVLGLLKPGVSLAAARSDLDTIMHRLSLTDPGPEATHRTSLAWLAGFGTTAIRPALLMLMAASGLVLIIACANVAGLLLLQSTERSRELAIRSAIGAGKSRLARQLITETLAIATLGGIVGLLLAEASLRLILLAAPVDIPRLWEARLDLPVLFFAAALTMMSGLLAGLAPLFTIGKVDLTTALKEGCAGAGSSARANRLRSALLIAEIAVTLILTFGCGLLLRSLALAQASYPGFSSSGLLALELQLPPLRYKNDNAIRQFYRRLTEALQSQPGVVSVGAVNCPPSTGGCARGWYSISDLPAPARSNVPLSLLTTVDSTYFGTMQIPLLAGRSFTHADHNGTRPVLIVNEKLARHWWLKEPQLAVGHPLKFGGPYMEGPTFEIVGVVADVKQAGLDEEPVAEIYAPFSQNSSAAMVVMIRAKNSPVSLIPAVQQVLGGIDSNIAIQSLGPFEQWIGGTLERRRFSTLLLAIFTWLAVALSAVGIYGVVNFWVGVRHKEIAIRVALGAQRLRILRWAGSYAFWMLGCGIALGSLGAFASGQALNSMVFGISARSPAMLLTAVVANVVVATLSASIPLWRATRIDGVRHLRDS